MCVLLLHQALLHFFSQECLFSATVTWLLLPISAVHIGNGKNPKMLPINTDITGKMEKAAAS